MKVGVRELRENLRSWLDRVKSGDELVVTERGKAVAQLVPLDSGRRKLEELIELGLHRFVCEQLAYNLLDRTAEMLIIDSCKLRVPFHVRIKRPWAEGEQRAEQGHVYGGEQERQDAGGAPTPAVQRIAAEGRQPHENSGDKKHPLLQDQHRGIVARRMMQSR